MLYTRCPHCTTIFRIQREQLEAAQGIVRCGRCNRVFNALENLSDQPPSAAAEAFAPRDESDLLSEEQPFSAIGSAPSKPTRIAESVAWLAGIFLLLALLLGQLVYFNRQSLASQAQIRPWLEPFCQAVGCTLPPYRDLSAIQVIDRDLREEPRQPGVLRLNITLRNDAPYPQPPPNIEITWLDSTGIGQARQTLQPEQYLGDRSGPLPPGIPVQGLAFIQENENTLSGFQLQLRSDRSGSR